MSDRPVHWPLLHGPEDQPDPRVGEMSASAAHRGTANPVLYAWDHWLQQPVRDIRADEGDAA